MIPQPPKPQLIPLSVAAKILDLSERRVQIMCQQGEFKTAVRPGGERGHYRVARDEVVKRLEPKREL